MKRTFVITLTLLLVIGITGMAIAEAEKVTLTTYDLVEGEEDAAGFAIINYEPENESTDAVIQVKLSGLLPNHEYVYKTNGKIFGETITTNKLGMAHFHFNFEEENVIDCNWEINIRDETGQESRKVLAYSKI